MTMDTSRRSSGRGGVYVNIGEPSLFYVELEEAESYAMLHTSGSSVLIRVRTMSGDDIVMRVSWSRYKRVAYGRGYTGMEECSYLSFVPKMYDSSLTRVGDTYVGVMTRQYMHGTPLSQVWAVMSRQEKDIVKRDIQMVSERIGSHTSDSFMALQGRNLSTGDPVQYINYRILLSKLTRDLRESDIVPLSADSFPCHAVMSHQDLSMDHVIVHEGRVSGIVGWGRCDYIPEVFDRLKYHFAQPCFEGEAEWYGFISRMPFMYESPPPLYSITCMYYHYNLRKNTTSSEYQHHLDNVLQSVSEFLVQQSKGKPKDKHDYDTNLDSGYDEAYEQCSENGGDQWSQDQHDNSPCDTEDLCENPFIDSHALESRSSLSVPIAYYKDEDQEIRDHVSDSESRCTSWNDDDTVLDILDILSVA